MLLGRQMETRGRHTVLESGNFSGALQRPFGVLLVTLENGVLRVLAYRLGAIGHVLPVDVTHFPWTTQPQRAFLLIVN